MTLQLDCDSLMVRWCEPWRKDHKFDPRMGNFILYGLWYYFLRWSFGNESMQLRIQYSLLLRRHSSNLCMPRYHLVVEHEVNFIELTISHNLLCRERLQCLTAKATNRNLLASFIRWFGERALLLTCTPLRLALLAIGCHPAKGLNEYWSIRQTNKLSWIKLLAKLTLLPHK